MSHLQKINIALSLMLFLVFMNSCISSRKIKYIQKEGDKVQTIERYKRKVVKYKLQSDDNVYVKFSSLEPVSNKILSSGNNTDVSQGMASKYKDVYQIDSVGYLTIPQLDKVYAKGLSLQQLKDSLEYKMKRFYQQITAQVRLADNYVTILGNVNNPGRYKIDFRDQISIFEIIGMAGDLSIEANRKEVRLVRNIGEETEIINLDLTKRSILESKYYYLMPNDILYVEPLKAMSWHQKRYPFTTIMALLLSTTTSILVILTYIK